MAYTLLFFYFFIRERIPYSITGEHISPIVFSLKVLIINRCWQKVWMRKLSLSTILIMHLRRRWTYKIDTFTRNAKDSGRNICFHGSRFCTYHKLVFFGYRFSQGTPFAFMRWIVKTCLFILSLTNVQNTPNHNKILQHFLLHSSHILN